VDISYHKDHVLHVLLVLHVHQLYMLLHVMMVIMHHQEFVYNVVQVQKHVMPLDHYHLLMVILVHLQLLNVLMVLKLAHPIKFLYFVMMDIQLFQDLLSVKNVLLIMQKHVLIP